LRGSKESPSLPELAADNSSARSFGNNLLYPRSQWPMQVKLASSITRVNATTVLYSSQSYYMKKCGMNVIPQRRLYAF
jgi:hypothetical protein